MGNVELLASFNPPQDTEFKLWARGKYEHLAGIKAKCEIGDVYKVIVSKKQNIRSDTPVRLDLDYTMIMALASSEKLKISLVFVEENEHDLQGYGKVLEVEPKVVILP